MRNERSWSVIVAMSIGATLTLAACAQNAAEPSGPSSVPLPSTSTTASAIAVPGPPRQTNQPVSSGAFVPPGAVPTGAATAPTDIAIGEIGPQPQPGGTLVTVPDGDWRYAVPPDTGPVPEAPDTGQIDGE